MTKIYIYLSIEKKKSKEFVKKVYASEIVALGGGGRPVVRWKDRVKKYMLKIVVDRRGRKEYLDMERRKLFCCCHPLEVHFWRE